MVQLHDEEGKRANPSAYAEPRAEAKAESATIKRMRESSEDESNCTNTNQSHRNETVESPTAQRFSSTVQFTCCGGR
jgi:hypothetical protein